MGEVVFWIVLVVVCFSVGPIMKRMRGGRHPSQGTRSASMVILGVMAATFAVAAVVEISHGAWILGLVTGLLVVVMVGIIVFGATHRPDRSSA